MKLALAMPGALLFAAMQISGRALDTSLFRGDANHTGVYDATGKDNPPQIKWKLHTDGRIYSSPAVADGVVYFGSTDHLFYAVNSETGTVKWTFKTGAGITSSPAVSDGHVYFGSYDGNFYALDAATGKPAWKFETGGERRYSGKHLHGMEPAGETMPDPFDFYLSSPVLSSDSVFFGSGDGNVYALNGSTGTLLWRVETGNVVHASPAIWNGTLFIGSWDTYFYAIDVATGHVKWRFKTGEDEDIHNQTGIQSSAAVVDGTVYFGCRDSNLYALDAETGQKKWVFNNKGSWVISSPAASQGKVYFSTSDSGMFYALDAKTGAAAFSLSLKWPMFSSPAVAGTKVYIGSNEGKLIAIDTATQKTAWTFQTDGSRENGAAWTQADGGPNYRAAFTDNFYEDGIIGVRKMLSVGAILSSPVAVGDVIFFGSSDGNLYAVQ